MDNKQYIQNETEYLFNFDFNDDTISEEIENAYLERANTLINSFPWNDIFICWFDYLQKKCVTPEQVINWANLFFWYGGCEQVIDKPYIFLGYLYYRVDIVKYAEKAQTIFDSVSISMLEKSGYINIIDTPNYVPENDPKMVKAIRTWQKSEEKNN